MRNAAGATTRLLQLSDVAELTALVQRNRTFLAPWEPARGAEHFSGEHQRQLVRTALAAYTAGSMVPLLILGPEGAVAGRLNINGIVRGAFQSGVLGYWVGQEYNGAGLASAAVAEAAARAAQMGLHRLQAETLVHNARSQRVLEKNGFVQYGLAPQYLKIAGRWQDHRLFQKILDPGHRQAMP